MIVKNLKKHSCKDEAKVSKETIFYQRKLLLLLLHCFKDPCHSQQLLSCPMSAMSATSHRASAKTKWGVFTLQSSLWGRKKTAWDILYTRFIIHGSQHEKGGHHFIVP